MAQADPDGYTLFFSTVGAIAINPAFRSDLTYDPLKDFAPVGEAAVNSPVVVGLRGHESELGARFRRAGEEEAPARITVGVTGRGAMSDLAQQLFATTAGIQLQSVPYRGAAPAITDISPPISTAWSATCRP